MVLSSAAFDAADAAQLAALVALVEREEQALLGHVDTTGADLVSQLTGPEAVGSAALAICAGDRLAGVAMVERIPQAREVFFDLRVDPRPPEPVRRAVRALLLDHCLGLAPTLAVDDSRTPEVGAPADPWLADPGTWQTVTGVYEPDTEGRSALTERGLRHVRTFARMRVDGAGPGPGSPPQNVTVRRVVSEADLRDVHRVAIQAFTEHWGTTHRDYADWMSLQRSRAGFDLSLWTVAELDDDVVGVCLMDRSREPMGYGYIATLGVLSHARHRGIADILLRTACADSGNRGLRGTELVVDSANSTGAGELYARAGMRQYQAQQVWLAPVSAL